MPRVAAHNTRDTIHSTAIKTRYRLAGSDLDSLEYTEEPNPHGGQYPVRKYRLADVEALAARTPGAAPASYFAPPNGPDIVRSHAMKMYNLKDVQMDRILPVRQEPNPHGGDRPVRYYNECDVKALARSVRQA
ncbi:hypothetical protein B0H11DRAFT_1177646 [Mycena galericulata]|nr:hypothetical protein B0H11DRAFT_1177646 [Mycena galericulata]